MKRRPVRKWDAEKSQSCWGGSLYKITGFWVFLNREEYSDGFHLEEVVMGKHGPTSFQRTGRYWPPGVTFSDAARYIIAERTFRMQCIRDWLAALRSGTPPEEASLINKCKFHPEPGLIAPRCEAWWHEDLR